MLKDEYPQILDIVVYSTDLMGGMITYRVGLGIKYADLLEMDVYEDDKLKEKVKNLSKYVLGRTTLENVFYFDPINKY